MWIYGIRLFLVDSIKEAKPSAFNSDIIQTFLSNRNKMSQGAEMAMKLLGYYDKQEMVNKEQFCQKNLENLASNSEYSECKNGVGRRDNEKECSNCEDNYEKSNSVECKSKVERKDDGNECSNCGGNNKILDIDIRSCTNSEMESKEAKPSAFNYKDFIQTFLSNGNGNISQEAEMVMRMLGHYNDKQKINMNNEFYQGNLKTFASNSEYLEYKCKNGRENNEKECSNHEDEHEKLNSFESKNRNVNQANKKDYSNCSKDSKQSDVDIKTYIDNKFYDMENKLMERINQIEVSTNQKLDAILERLEALKLK